MTGSFMVIFNFVVKKIKLLLKFARLILFIYNGIGVSFDLDFIEFVNDADKARKRLMFSYLNKVTLVIMGGVGIYSFYMFGCAIYSEYTAAHAFLNFLIAYHPLYQGGVINQVWLVWYVLKYHESNHHVAGCVHIFVALAMKDVIKSNNKDALDDESEWWDINEGL